MIHPMLGISHQMVALLAALWLLTIYPISLGTLVGILAVIAVMVGALTPDLDHPTAAMGQKILGAKYVHRLFGIFSGGHRHFTHSLLGIFGIGYLTYWIGQHIVNPVYHQQAYQIWIAFMIGYISHPIADTLTDQGVPWLWPMPWNIKFPPGSKAIRITTGSWVELLLVRFGIIVSAVLILQSHWPALVGLFR